MCVSDLMAIASWKYPAVRGWKIVRQAGEGVYRPLYAESPFFEEGQDIEAVYLNRRDARAVAFNMVQNGLFESFLRKEDAQKYMYNTSGFSTCIIPVVCKSIHAFGSDNGYPVVLSRVVGIYQDYEAHCLEKRIAYVEGIVTHGWTRQLVIGDIPLGEKFKIDVYRFPDEIFPIWIYREDAERVNEEVIKEVIK